MTRTAAIDSIGKKYRDSGRRLVFVFNDQLILSCSNFPSFFTGLLEIVQEFFDLHVDFF